MLAMYQIYFSFDNVSVVGWAALAVAALCVIWLLTAYRLRVLLPASVARRQMDQAAEAPDEGGGSHTVAPDVSVIVYGTGNVEGLEKLMGQLATQEYEGKVEIVVVNDGTSGEMSDVVTRFGIFNPGKEVYYTYVPDGARNLSRKKLCISLGVKAARHEVVVLTTSDCTLPGPRWLSRMTAPLAEGKDVVLGVARFGHLTSAADRFDEVATIVGWLTQAIKGHPYRGCGFNLAYRRRLFFDVKGFADSLRLHFGDDDLFVNRIATRQNTAVVLGRDTVVKVDTPAPAAAFREQRLRHMFTGRRLRGAWRPRLFFGCSTIMMWVWLAATASCIVLTLPNALPGCVAVALIPALWIPLCAAWRRTGKSMGVRLCRSLLPWNMMTRWARQLVWSIVCGLPSRKNYTWRS